MDLSTVAYELYGLSPGEFVSARDARASEAKKAGDRELASAIKQLRRPTTGAWLANLLVRERRDQVTELVDLGDDMRRAQHDLAGKDLRDLSTLRRQLVTALAAEAREIAGAHGHEVNEPSLHEVEATLEAAVADRGAGEALVSGNLTISLRYSGFGSVDLTGVVASPPATPPVAKKSTKTAKAPIEDPIEDVEGLLAGARAEESAARQAVGDADVQLEAAHEQRTLLEQRMSDLEQQLRELRGGHDQAKRTEREARKRSDLAKRNLEQARDRVAAMTAELERLRSTK
jgi:hypothetical protein